MKYMFVLSVISLGACMFARAQDITNPAAAVLTERRAHRANAKTLGTYICMVYGRLRR
jgi:hypothetical protein